MPPPARLSSPDDFTLINTISSRALFPAYEESHSAPVADTDVKFTAALRKQYPDLNVTVIPASNAQLLAFAGLGHATVTLDTDTDSIIRWRGWIGPSHRGGSGSLGDAVFFAKYHYTWGNEDFIVYLVGSGYQQLQYILKEPDTSKKEDTLSHCAKTDALILAVVDALQGDVNKFIYVYDNFWQRSRELWDQVQHASWSKVILNPDTKHALTDVASSFFDSEETYRKYGVPWKRGVIFHGPPGNGKTISIKALMKTLYDRDSPVPSLYVKSAPSSPHLRLVFAQARVMSPCMLVFEDIETIVNSQTRSYFFNEVDGLASNDGILMVASTNYLERLDPGLAKRPSRFDRKYLFPLPDAGERALYCAFWRKKLQKAKSDIPFPEKLDKAIAGITHGFSFAYLQEAFVATMLVIAREGVDEEQYGTEDVADLAGWFDGMHARVTGGGGDDSLRGYKLWRVMQKQVAMLREDMGDDKDESIAAARAGGDLGALLDALQGLHVAGGKGEQEQARASSHHSAMFFDATDEGLPVASASAAALRVPCTQEEAASGASSSRPGRGERAARTPTSQDMAMYGITKSPYFAATAYEWHI